jgi:hypothetical protein
MLRYISELMGTRAEDGSKGIAGLNLRMTQFAERRPVAALVIIGVLVAYVIYLIFA